MKFFKSVRPAAAGAAIIAAIAPKDLNITDPCKWPPPYYAVGTL